MLDSPIHYHCWPPARRSPRSHIHTGFAHVPEPVPPSAIPINGLLYMHTDWKTPYELALHEQNPANLEGVYERARHAIHNRMLELDKDRADICESGELDEALRQLTIHKYQKHPVR